MNGSLFSRNLTEASTLAQSKLEELVPLTFTSVGCLPLPTSGTAGPGVYFTDTSPVDALGNPGGIYTRTLTLGPCSDPTTSFVRQITSTVTWPNPGGAAPHTVSIIRFKVPQ